MTVPVALGIWNRKFFFLKVSFQKQHTHSHWQPKALAFSVLSRAQEVHKI